MFNCTKCHKEFDTTPELSDNWHWEGNNIVEDNICDCGGQVVSGFCKGLDYNICSDGDPIGFWSLEMGALGEQQAEIKKEQPSATFNQFGARWVASPKALKKVLKERDMVELTEDRKYREKANDALEKAREGARSRR